MGFDYNFRSDDFKFLHDAYLPMMFRWNFYDGIDTLFLYFFLILKCLMILRGCKV
jgi:hypothetical protein